MTKWANLANGERKSLSVLLTRPHLDIGGSLLVIGH